LCYRVVAALGLCACAGRVAGGCACLPGLPADRFGVGGANGLVALRMAADADESSAKRQPVAAGVTATEIARVTGIAKPLIDNTTQAGVERGELERVAVPGGRHVFG
jgi:hypothetical protein